MSLKKRMKLLNKERVIYIYIKTGITINLKHLSKEYSQLLVVSLQKKRKKIVLFSDSILKNLRMGEFNSFIKKREVSLKAFPGAKARQLNHYTIPLLEDNTYDGAIIHVGINDLLSNDKSTNDICKEIIDIVPRCRNDNIGMIFISSIAYSSKVNPSLLQVNGLLFDECRRNDFKFVDNGAVSEIDLWIDGIHMTESGKRIIANN